MRKQTCPAGASTKLSSPCICRTQSRAILNPQSTALNGPFTLVTPLVKRLEYHVFFRGRDRFAAVGDINTHLLSVPVAMDTDVTGFSAIVHRIGVEIIHYAYQ